ncbi:hypothetical protein STEG23_002234 [Scotinomys teguina]
MQKRVEIQGLSQDSCSERIISEKPETEWTQKASEITLAPEGLGLTFFKEFSVGGIDIMCLDDIIVVVVIIISSSSIIIIVAQSSEDANGKHQKNQM